MRPLVILCFSLFLIKINSIAQASLTNNEIDRILNFRLTIYKNSNEGATYKVYYFTNKKIYIYEKPFPTDNYKERLYTKHKHSAKELFLKILKLKLDSLKEEYYNNCIDSSSGQDFSIIISTRSKQISKKLHHYYLKEIDDLVTLLNSYLPQTMQIPYLDKETKQDCSKLE